MPDSQDENNLPRWCKLDTVEDLRRRQMRALKTAERIMYESYENGDMEGALKAATRLTQAARCYLKTVEAHELEERVEALEEKYAEVNGP
jgi:hypothetical protein